MPSKVEPPQKLLSAYPNVATFQTVSRVTSVEKQQKIRTHKCCEVVKKVHTSCLCALLLSKESKSLGIKPEVAATIPKRCKIKAKHSKDYKCGGHSVPAWEEH
ncbi:uncharacterized protein Pyn_11410 [Prunus yedoensis var. nudiflora]|uniref:Bifunctional inhibitor/plant lipid transfer protein/seed storage helical domain-containing protein n=1 Tax=Prunus yedoensis var. nudiflora TaxID=2094558 RepID=A0A314UZV0_PRUYE|nr:uncharacterized protein Pyn_11410 [Prunus yedoensis var. nudiflora]